MYIFILFDSVFKPKLWVKSISVILLLKYVILSKPHTIKNIQENVFYLTLTQPAFTCLKSTIETPEQKYEICSKLTIMTSDRHQ